MSMNQEPDHMFDEMNIKAKLACGCLAASLIVLAILGVTLYQNRKGMFDGPAPAPVSAGQISENQVDEDFTLEGSTLTSDDLDFWGMYDTDDEQEEFPANQQSRTSGNQTPSGNPSENRAGENGGTVGDGVSGNTISGSRISENGVSGNQVSQNELLSNVPKNTYEKGSFRKEDGRLEYYRNNTKISSIGIDVSKYQGDIDWEKVKGTGIDFAMIRMGVRGYSSGNVVMDENYVKNMEGALAQGLKVGVYFYSQAVSREEAIEEANYAVAAAQKYKISYPIVFYSERIENDMSRTDQLTPEQLSEYARAFCDTVKHYGYVPMIMGDKDHLLQNMDLERVRDYDWWLSDLTDFSDFPYKYSMWQYADNGKVDGISGNVNLNISFVDFAYK